ncbi:MAG: aldehyde ferredoxin oxidoreductase [Nitrososphaeria archaeon]|nr:aldehyde ferredoxin oxidoreductase [Nitrososphaeria archaeon]NIN52073.1 aldehyde ferredoxin oxidoreductase [Nitrososphaeria archaeon]NIQ32533.1 aldehyde ferredoxin oxidoreductase [Nitrososphaeria archaeon]
MNVFGWKGTALEIDLSKGKFVKRELNSKILQQYMGGRGLNIKTLYDLTRPDVKPFDAENPLILGVGPITGTLVPGNGRHNVTSKSPLTGILGDSNSGGFWGPELKFAGYDQLAVMGRSQRPVYIWIDDDEVEVKDASHIWGKTTHEADRIIKEEVGDESIQIAVIGQAGENLVKFAAVINNLARAAGRTGMGAVMGSKRLKAVVVRGSGDVPVAHSQLLREVYERVLEKIYDSPGYNSRSKYGTPGLIQVYNGMGILPTRNSQTGVFEKGGDISGEELFERYVRKNKSCFSCPVHCSRLFTLEDGPYAGTSGEGPEYETLCSLGSRCGNNDLESILYSDTLANQFGLDTISMGVVISFAMECYERGIITSEDADGLELEWGSHEAVIKLIEKIAHREGFGDTLAEGVKRAAEKIGRGAERYALHVKGLETPEQEVRGLKAMALGWAVASRGADHLRALPAAETLWTPREAKEMFGAEEAADRFAYKGKPEMVKWFEELCALADSLEICKFVIISIHPELDLTDLAEIVYAVTDWKVKKEELLQIGERIVNVERLYNTREGLTRRDDRLPERYLREPLPEGPSKGQTVNLEPLLDRYYALRGWDLEKGRPSRGTLERLGIGCLQES